MPFVFSLQSLDSLFSCGSSRIIDALILTIAFVPKHRIVSCDRCLCYDDISCLYFIFGSEFESAHVGRFVAFDLLLDLIVERLETSIARLISCCR